MGGYIPKIEMPQNCSFCPCARMNISRNGIKCSAVDFYAENLMPQKGRMECCPLVEVKPHGDLIDKGVLKISLLGEEYGTNFPTVFNQIIKVVNSVPVVVESEEE